MYEENQIHVSKDTQSFVRYLSELPSNKKQELFSILEALKNQQDAEANLEHKRGWRYMWQRTPKPYLLMLAYLVFLAPVGSVGYSAIPKIGDNYKLISSLILAAILILPLGVVFFISYNYIKNKKQQNGKI